MFLLMSNYLLFIFICILNYENDVRQKADLSNFLVQIKKWVIKQQRQFATSATHLAQELLMNVQCSSSSRNFAKAFKMRSAVASH